jgi:hypothetical protein
MKPINKGFRVCHLASLIPASTASVPLLPKNVFFLDSPGVISDSFSAKLMASL